jgi:hypothetical protein
MRVRLLAGLFFALVALVTRAVAFDGVTIFVGGDKGARYEDNCDFDAAHAGYALVAIDYVAGKDLDRVTAVCALVRNGQPDRDPNRLLIRGMDNDNGSQRTRGNEHCPDGMFVQAIHVTESSVLLVHHFWLTCRNPFTGQKVDTPESGTFGGRGGAPGYADCGDDSYARGLRIRGDARISALGLICATYQPPPPPVVTTPPPPPPPPPPPEKPKPEKPPLKVLNGDDNADTGDGNDNGNNDAADAGTASAATDTTIYDQPGGSDVDYLTAGDPVTIVDCNGDNWCRISKPRKGWVWGGDLNR